jgi:UDP-2,3-diacylglucosamine pyrophosphatase LpxH
MDAPPRPAEHTIVVSDLHLTEVEAPDPLRPLWMRYKHRDLVIDGCFARFLEHQRAVLPPGAELVLNGDIFDFDAVRAIPHAPDFPVNWLERKRGLAAEEPKSLSKIRVILRDHPVFVTALRDWILAGHRAVLIVGNHDAEMWWPEVQQAVLEALELPQERQDALRICDWFYVSNADTLIEHGSQYDAYCVCPDPLHPRIRIRGRERVRIPFGDQAGRMMLNGMGLFNPYVESTFIKPWREYLRFFFKHVIRIQPLLGWSWLWGAVATLMVSLRDGFKPSLRDPLAIEERENEAARRSNVRPATLRALRAVRVHPAIFNPWKVLKELWLDRALLLALTVFVCFQAVGFLNVFSEVSPWWAFAFFAALLPPFAFYARSVNSDVGNTNRALRRRLPVALRIVGASRAVIGHTHEEGHLVRDETEVLNTGTWSPAFEDVEYTRPFGRKCFAWIRPGEDGVRFAELHEWTDPGCARIDRFEQPQMTRLEAITRRLPAVKLPGRKG